MNNMTHSEGKKKIIGENRISHYNSQKANIGEENCCLKEKDWHFKGSFVSHHFFFFNFSFVKPK